MQPNRQNGKAVSDEEAMLATLLKTGNPTICYQGANAGTYLSKKSPRATFGTCKSRFDVTKMGSMNQSMWIKGLKYF